jgi:hypothetical protein
MDKPRFLTQDAACSLGREHSVGTVVVDNFKHSAYRYASANAIGRMPVVVVQRKNPERLPQRAQRALWVPHLGSGIRLPPCLAIVFWMHLEPDCQISCRPASPKSTTLRFLGTPSCGDAASTAALSVDLNNSSVSTHGIVVSFSACTNTSWRCAQRPGMRQLALIHLDD